MTSLTHFNPSELADTYEQIALKAIEQARYMGADEAACVMSAAVGIDLTVRQQDVETFESVQEHGLSIQVYVGQCSGAASTTDLSPESVHEAVSAALAIARQTQADEAAGLPDPAWYAEHRDTSVLETFHPQDWPVEVMIQKALEAERAGLGVDRAIKQCEGIQIGYGGKMRLLADSQGFLGWQANTRYGASATFLAQSDEGMQRDFDYESSLVLSELGDLSDMAIRAAKKARARLNPKKPPIGRFPVIFSPWMARGVWGHLLSAISGTKIYQKTSFLIDKLDQRLFPEWLSVWERPHLPKESGSALFDSEGVATKEKALIDAGRLKTYLLSSYSARRLGMASTGNAGGVHNLRLEGKTQSVSDMMQSIGSGLLVTELMGQGVNLVTGDYSRGASGFWIENGEVAFPVAQITIAGNLSDMFKNIQALGSDIDSRGNVHTGSLLIDGMTVGANNEV